MLFLKPLSVWGALRVRQKLNLTIFALVAALLASTAAALLVSRAQRADLATVGRGIEDMKSRLIPLESAVRDLQYDVVQMQQILTFVSATHNGDGYEDASKDMTEIGERLAAVRTLVKDFTDPATAELREKILTDLTELEPQFEPYYNQGVKAAHAYVESGFDDGNYEMDAFDNMSDALIARLDTLLIHAKRMVTLVSGGARDNAAKAADAAAGLALLMQVLFGFGIAVAAASYAYVQRGVLAPLSRVGAALAGGVDDAATLDPKDAERGDEFGEMARALLGFQRARRETLRLENEAARMREAGEAERASHAAAAAAAAGRQAQAMERIRHALARLADGDLGARIDDAFAREYEGLREDFNAALAKLAGAMRSVGGAVDVVRDGAAGIMSASGELADRTAQQASSLQDTMSQLTEVAGGVRQTSLGADDALKLVDRARRSAGRGDETVRNAVVAMRRIESSSSQIGQIIGVIDEIAFQTNLLALNAGVEAARAGESGRGFAVVASEVRALAQRSADAAREIKQLILASTSEVGEGVALVGSAGEALTEIDREVAQIAESVRLIALNARQQAGALETLSGVASELDRSVQNNAAMSEETTTACASLAQQSDRLSELVARFRSEPLAEVRRRA